MRDRQRSQESEPGGARAESRRGLAPGKRTRVEGRGGTPRPERLARGTEPPPAMGDFPLVDESWFAEEEEGEESAELLDLGDGDDSAAPEDIDLESSALNDEEEDEEEEDGSDELARAAVAGEASSARDHLPNGYARTDEYSRARIKSNKVPKSKRAQGRKRVRGRAGVRFRGRDVWEVADNTPRYMIRNPPDQVEETDRVTANQVALPPAPARPWVAINPARPRKLLLPGNTERVWCILTWAGGGYGSAWMAVSSLRTRHRNRIRRKAAETARRWGPARPPRRAIEDSAPHQFRPADPDQLPALRDRFVAAGQRLPPVANVVNHYLYSPSTNYYCVVQALPQGDAAPIAIDIARPGDQFFVASGRDFKRLAGTFGGRGNHDRPERRSHYMRWVFGFLGRDGEPDPSRRGWVPEAVLEPAPIKGALPGSGTAPA